MPLFGTSFFYLVFFFIKLILTTILANCLETLSSLFQTGTPAAPTGSIASHDFGISQNVQVSATASRPTVQIDFEPDGYCSLSLINKNGKVEGTFPCGGQMGRSYPKNTIFNPNLPKFKEKMHYSREFANAPMPYSLRIWPQKGIFIHEWDALSVSHGCIHLLPGTPYTCVHNPHFNFPPFYTLRSCQTGV